MAVPSVLAARVAETDEQLHGLPRAADRRARCRSARFLLLVVAALAAAALGRRAASLPAGALAAAPPLAGGRLGIALGGGGTLLALGRRRTFHGRDRGAGCRLLLDLVAGDGGDREVTILMVGLTPSGSFTAEIWTERPISRPSRSNSK